ncbi:DUF4476 domain-containing protein [Myxococcaceae bacterium GXIMD 01537]
MKSLVAALAVLLASSSALADDPAELRRHNPGPSSPGYPGPSSPPGYPDGYQSAVVVNRSELASRMERLGRLLEDAAERNYDSRQGRKLRRAMEELNEMQRLLANAPEVRGGGYNPPRPQPQPIPQPPPPPVVRPIDDGRFKAISDAMDHETFSKDKLALLRDAASRNNFLVNHVRFMVQKFQFSSDQLEVVRILWPRTLDRENGFQLQSSFTFSSDKQKLREIINM